MDFGDVGAGLLSDLGRTATNAALASTEDSSELHSVLQGIAGGSPQAQPLPSPATGTTRGIAANVPQSDQARQKTFWQKPSTWIAIAGVVVLLGALGVVRFKGIGAGK